MNNLLAKSPVLPKESQIIRGNVIEIGKNTVFIDLGPIGTGVILGREIKENQETIKHLKPGDEIFAMVLETENENGFVELSLKAANKQTAWEELTDFMQQKQPISTKIIKANKGGLMVELRGIPGFLPVSQLSYEHYPRVEDSDKTKILSELNKFVGKDMAVRIIDLDPAQQKLIVSEKALEEERLKEILKNFKIGDMVVGTVSGVVDFGAFVRINPLTQPSNDESDEKKEEAAEQTEKLKADEKNVETNLNLSNAENEDAQEQKPEIIEGLIHISEIDWQLIDDPRKILEVGQTVRAKIIGIEGQRLSLSLKALKKDPWSLIDEKYKKGQVVKGQVTKFNPFGAFVQLDQDIHGLIHISEFGNEINMKQTLQIGQEYEFKILSIEPKVHKMALGLVKAEEQKTE